MNENAEDITLRAIGRTPKRDRVRVESLLAEDLELAEQLRETEDLAVEIWQASSPLESAPPELWEEIQSSLTNPPSPFTKYWLPAMASLGWAAALALAFLFAFKNDPLPNATAQVTADPDVQAVETSSTPTETPIAEPEENLENIALENQIAHLEQRLAELQNASRASIAPKVIALHPPDSASPYSPEEERAQIFELIAAALAENLQRQGEHPVDLVIEEGWDPSAFPTNSELLIRHRNFLAATAELDLMIASNGDYYDPNSNYLWSPAEDGGGHLGRFADDSLDLESFAWVERDEKETTQEIVLSHESEGKTQQGFVLQDTESGNTTLVLNKLDESLEDTALVANFTEPDGTTQQQQLQPSSIGGTSVFSVGNVDFTQILSISAFTNINQDVQQPILISDPSPYVWPSQNQ